MYWIKPATIFRFTLITNLFVLWVFNLLISVSSQALGHFGLHIDPMFCFIRVKIVPYASLKIYVRYYPDNYWGVQIKIPCLVSNKTDSFRLYRTLQYSTSYTGKSTKDWQDRRFWSNESKESREKSPSSNTSQSRRLYAEHLTQSAPLELRELRSATTTTTLHFALAFFWIDCSIEGFSMPNQYMFLCMSCGPPTTADSAKAQHNTRGYE